MKRLALLSTFLPALALAAEPGDGIVVHFKDGGRVPGVLVERTAEEVLLEVPSGRIGFPAASVARIESKPTDLSEFKKLAAGADAARLARFAKERGLHTQYNRLAEELDLPGPSRTAAPPSAAAAMEPIEVVVRVKHEFPEPTGERPSERPTLGFGAGPRDLSTSPAWVRTVVVPAAAFPPMIDERREAFLARQKVKRQAFRRTFRHPYAELQFRLQEALDRNAHGLSFASEPF